MKKPNPASAAESQPKNIPIATPLYWKYRKIAAVITGPLIVIACVVAWNWIPIREASYQQNELAKEFFHQCYLVFADTSAVPKIPDEPLHVAQRKQSVTTDALRSWGPQVSADIRDGYWWAKIQFSTPNKKVYEQRIGVAVNDVGYNTPSERS
ncbi:MAG: hypothetical protein P4L46_08435 [Fimbriimonas sp.]|nr:hypothetical protein [Fimbriimonas sp.]